ncbi:UNKNOWN [Stylonychia lemnae]|uniref:Uncharacterized protein n=1 Tax=Stylonychia lemnae TaxID=5949 RepID=A0A077ZX69_STYLE|nr:UNKNOWN [Stylonychia lemnae]|eukprot:CDW73837.1 UNKNOWN [Stylonychia lemnae]
MYTGQQHSQSKRKRLINTRPKKSNCQLLLSRFKGVDQFGTKVQLTFQGKESYKTSFGAFVSLILIITLMSYGIYKGQLLFNKYNPNISKVSLIRDMGDGLEFQPAHTGFDFAIGLQKELDPSYGHITINDIIQIESEQNGTSKSRNRTKVYNPMEYEKCGTSKYNYTQAECQDQNVIDDYFNDEVFSLAIVNTYFDFFDFKDNYPIKKFIDDSFFVEVEASKIKKANIYIQLQDAQLQDNYLQLGQTDQIQFHQISNNREYDKMYVDSDGYMIALFLRLDDQYDLYNRKIYSFLELLGDIGGLYRSLQGIGLFIVGKIAGILFLSDVMNKIYQVRKNFESDNDKDKKQQNGNKVQDNSEQSTQRQQNPSDPNNSLLIENQTRNPNYLSHSISLPNNSENNKTIDTRQVDQSSSFTQVPESNNMTKQGRIIIKTLERYLSNLFKGKRFINDQDVQNILQAFISRVRFSYSPLKIIVNILRCARPLSHRQLKDSTIYKSHHLFLRGKEKLERDLDVIQLVRTLRKFKLLCQAQLDQQHRMLLRFQKQNLIETSSESSDSDDNHLEPVGLLESTIPIIKLVALGKLKRMVKSFEGMKLDHTESNLIRGVFKRKLKDFEEDFQQENGKLTLMQRLNKNGGIRRYSNYGSNNHDESVALNRDEENDSRIAAASQNNLDQIYLHSE